MRFLNLNQENDDSNDSNEIFNYGKTLFAKTNIGSKEIITIKNVLIQVGRRGNLKEDQQKYGTC